MIGPDSPWRDAGAATAWLWGPVCTWGWRSPARDGVRRQHPPSQSRRPSLWLRRGLLKAEMCRNAWAARGGQEAGQVSKPRRRGFRPCGSPSLQVYAFWAPSRTQGAGGSWQPGQRVSAPILVLGQWRAWALGGVESLDRGGGRWGSAGGSRPPTAKPAPCGIRHVAASPDLSSSSWTRAKPQAQSCPLLEVGRFPREKGGARGWPGQERSGKSRPWGWVWGLASSRSCGSLAPPPDPASCSLLWGASTSSPPAGVLAHVTIY